MSINKQRGNAPLVILGLAAVLLAGVAGYSVVSKTAVPPTANKQMGQTPSPTPAGWVAYTDPQKRFSFSYPPAFGAINERSDSGFGDTVASFKFSEFSNKTIQTGNTIKLVTLGGDAVLTKGRVVVDMQAVGGLYNSATLSAIPPGALRDKILANLVPLTAVNFCKEFAKEQHLDLQKPALASLNKEDKAALNMLDRMRNSAPKVVRCDVSGDTVTFDKEVTAEFGKAKNKQHIYGTIRFLKPPYSSFQFIQAAPEAPSQETLRTITSVVTSFK